jgi:PilZ domain
MSIDQRKSRRYSVDHGARIVWGDGSNPQHCRILDVSAHGAQLELKTTVTVPDKFTLLLSHDGGLRRECSVTWRSENAVGIEFSQPFPTKLGRSADKPVSSDA